MQKLDANDVRYTRLRKALTAHLRLNKKSLDKSIRGICIIDLNGKTIASTDRHNVNRDISMSAYFKQGQRVACVSDVYPLIVAQQQSIPTRFQLPRHSWIKELKPFMR